MAETPTRGSFRFFVIERQHTGPMTCRAGPYLDYHIAKRERDTWATVNRQAATYEVIHTDDIEAYIAWRIVLANRDH